jgi:(p)ppGpp synthase/HD superfamily hydrolase
MAQQANQPSVAGAKLTSRFTDAFGFAFQVHRKQTKKGSAVPYISHLLEVAGIVLAYGGDEDEAIAALLHDSVEDHPDIASFDAIGKRYGVEVAGIVESCSDASTIPKPPWKGRKEAYIAHLRHADQPVLMVSAADKLVNARAVLKDYREVGDQVWERFNAGKSDQLWYYREVTRALIAAAGDGRARALVEELARVVGELENLCGGAQAKSA